MYVRNLWNFMFTPFVESLREEMELEILVDGIDAFKSCLQLIGENSMSVEQINAIKDLLLGLMEDVDERKRQK